MSKGIILVLSGPSGVGKGTVRGILTSLDSEFELSISATTRAPRKGEVDGVHYYFVSAQRFEQLIAENAFAEHVQIYGNRYGTLNSELKRIADNGRSVVLDIEMEGALNVKRMIPEAVLVYILPPSLAELDRRLENRGSETAESLKQRQATTLMELDMAYKYDYVVLNASPEVCAAEIEQIVLSERKGNRFMPCLVSENQNKIELIKTGGSLC